MKKRAKIYHEQADIDRRAKKEEYFDNIPSSSYKQIQEAYREFMDDLMMESQEAY